MSEELRVCRKCHLELPIEEFSVADRATGLRRRHCRACENARVRAFYAENPQYRQMTKERSRKWASDNPKATRAHQRRSSLKYKYGISERQYQLLLETQGGGCALCHSMEVGRVGKSGKWEAGEWHVDHCHKDNRVRGLLCHKCNVRLGAYEGLMQDIGEAAVLDYLTRPSPILALPVEVAPATVPRRYIEELPPLRAPANPCSVSGCVGGSVARGFCQKHYARFLRRDGDVGGAEELPRGTMRGAAHPKSKLTEADIRFIRASGDAGVRLAAQFGVTATLISNIRNGKVWRHIN